MMNACSETVADPEKFQSLGKLKCNKKIHIYISKYEGMFHI
jgi:hypothetical protein